MSSKTPIHLPSFPSTPYLSAHKKKVLVRLIPSLILSYANVVCASKEGANPSADKHIEEVVVIGQAGLMQKALDKQRLADNIITAISADGIGQLPDTNMAEALQRVPGISVERDQGEGRFVRIRGISPDLNTVTVNGTQMPAPEAGRRAVALDVVPSALLSSLVVSKTLTPDMDANAIGGNVDVESLSALDRSKAFYTLRTQAGYDDLTKNTSPSVSLSAGDVLNRNGENRLGVVAAFSWDERTFGSDNVETGGAWDFSSAPAQLEEIEQRDYSIVRERLGAALNFDYAPSDKTTLYWHTLYSEFTDDEQRLANVIEFVAPELDDSGVPLLDDGEPVYEGSGRVEGDTGFAEVARELKDRAETQKIVSTTLGGEHYVSDWIIEYAIGLSKASESEPGGIGGAVFNGGVQNEIGFMFTREPHLIAGDSFYNAQNFTLDEVEYTKAKTEDAQTSVKLDVMRELDWGNHPTQIKVGVKTSQREKSQDTKEYVYKDFDSYGFSDESLLLSEFSSGAAAYGLGRFGPIINPSAVYAVINSLDSNTFLDEEESRLASHDIEETVNAAYVMARVDIDKWRLLTGVRYEGTEHVFSGVALNADEEFTDINDNNDYNHFLPSLQVRYAINSHAQVRAAWTNAVVRPTFEQMAPSFSDDGEEAEFGNTKLEAMESNNIDVGIEYFSGSAGVLSAFLFHKDLDNFIFATDLANTEGWEAYSEVITYSNGDEARITGLELAYSKKLDALPPPFNGLLISTNITLSDSSATISSSDGESMLFRDVRFPSQSDTTGNFVLGYETKRWMLRAAVNYKSEYLLEVGGIEDDSADVLQAAQTQVDLSAQIKMSERLKVTFDMANVTNEPYYTYVNQKAYNAQYEEYGSSFRLSINYSSF